MDSNYNLKSMLAVRVASKIADNLHYIGATSNPDLANELFDILADALVHVPNDKLLALSEGIRDARQVADDFGTTD